MGHNLLVLAVAALIPLIVGSAWYSPLLFAKPWMAATGRTPEDAKNTNMVLNMAVLYVLSFFVAIGLMFASIHQFGLNSMLMDEGGKASLANHDSSVYKAIVVLWHSSGHSFRTYKHGAFHGFAASLFFALPLIASGAIFEGRGVKYVLITWGFWVVNFILMGAVICHWIAFELVQG